MKTLICIATLLIVIDGAMVFAQQEPASIAITSIDGFRGLKWHSTESDVLSKIGAQRHTKRDTNGYTVINVPNQPAFGLQGTVVFWMKNGELVAGAWCYPNRYQSYPFAQSVLERDIVMALNLLTNKYGPPSSYGVNGAARSYVGPEAASSDYRTPNAPVNTVEVDWKDVEGNTLTLLLKPEEELMIVQYLSKNLLQDLKQDEY